MELVVALDRPSGKMNLKLAESLAGLPIWLKVGFRSFIRDGKGFVETLRSIDSGFRIFLDLKLYDIPNTMADAAEEIASLGVDMFNVHASAGEEAMSAVMERLQSDRTRPLVLAVTALTSFDEKQFCAVYGDEIAVKASQFAQSAHKCGLDGVVCSVWESRAIKEATRESFLTLTPGIRPFGEDANDQKRIAGVADAKNEHVDYIVVGRPIYQADNPKEAAAVILNAIDPKGC